MRRSLVIAAVVVGLLVVTSMASASSTSKSKAKAASAAQLYTPAGNNWIVPGGDNANSRYSSLTQINTKNVSKLKLVWQTSLWPAGYGAIGAEAATIALNGIMYMPTPLGVTAMNGATGQVVWKYEGAANPNAGFSALGLNILAARGLSAGNGMIFAGQQDGSIVALNQQTGAAIWTAQVAAVGTYAGKTNSESNPFTVYYNDGKDGLVFAGINGGDSPLRGHIDAYDAKTGTLVWRTFTTPDPTQLPYILTWGDPAEAAQAGGAVWSIPAIDSKLGTLFVGTGNPYPYTGRSPGKDLWTDSLLALNVNTGALKWYYQAVHHDLWDYDCPTPPVLFNTTVKGKAVQGVAVSCKSGYIYELTRAGGHPIFPIPEVKIEDPSGGAGQALNNTWPTQPEPTGGAAQILPHCATAATAGPSLPGYPTAPDGKPYIFGCPYEPSSANGYVVWGPYFAFGGTDYPPMSYNPTTGDLYVCANVTWQATENQSAASTTQRYATSGGYNSVGESGTVSALNLGTNKLDWQIKYQATKDGACYSGALTTAGGLLFTASRGPEATGLPAGTPTGGRVYAYNAKTGKQLWSYQNDMQIQAPPVTFMANGKQYLAIDLTAGKKVLTFPGFGNFDLATKDRLAVFALG
jgi:quinohemoprotein ethanol dehydrogenase